MTAHATVRARLLDQELRFQVPPGLFSADRVDDGTRLLLDHLPPGAPRTVLDLGCGWGALGLPVAARHPQAHLTLVDRDVLAVTASTLNATLNDLGNVACRPSLGYRDVGEGPFDWILCNVPARIGRDAIALFLGRGAALLSPGGELRCVVITDLAPVVEAVAHERGWPIRRVADGPRHVIYAMEALATGVSEPEEVYRRDTVVIGGRSFERPHDINETPGHLREAVPLLLDCLPRRGTPALCWRAGYGPVPAALVDRGCEVTVVDRDLLSLTFAARNTGGAVRVVPATGLTGLHAPLVVGELYPNVGVDGLTAELEASTVAAGAGGQALWLGPARLVRTMATAIARLKGATVASRGEWSVVRLPGRR